MFIRYFLLTSFNYHSIKAGIHFSFCLKIKKKTRVLYLPPHLSSAQLGLKINWQRNKHVILMYKSLDFYEGDSIKKITED